MKYLGRFGMDSRRVEPRLTLKVVIGKRKDIRKDSTDPSDVYSSISDTDLDRESSTSEESSV